MSLHISCEYRFCFQMKIKDLFECRDAVDVMLHSVKK